METAIIELLNRKRARRAGQSWGRGAAPPVLRQQRHNTLNNPHATQRELRVTAPEQRQRQVRGQGSRSTRGASWHFRRHGPKMRDRSSSITHVFLHQRCGAACGSVAGHKGKRLFGTTTMSTMRFQGQNCAEAILRCEKTELAVLGIQCAGGNIKQGSAIRAKMGIFEDSQKAERQRSFSLAAPHHLTLIQQQPE